MNNNNMMGNMMPNFQNFNNFNNNGNNFNNNFMMNNGMNMNFIQNMNMNMQGVNISEAQNWQGIYTPQVQNQNMQQMPNEEENTTPGKVNVILTTTRGIKVNMKIDFGKRVCDLIKLYFKLINREDLLNNPQELCFIYNAKKMKFNDQTPVQIFFGSSFARITINDTRGLIGA